MSDAHLKMLLVHCRQVRRLVVAEVLSVEEDQDTVSPVEVQQCARLLERFSATLERADISGLCDKQGRPPPSLLQALYKCKALRKIEWWGVYLPPPQLRELIRGMPLLEGLGVDNVDAF